MDQRNGVRSSLPEVSASASVLSTQWIPHLYSPQNLPPSSCTLILVPLGPLPVGWPLFPTS